MSGPSASGQRLAGARLLVAAAVMGASGSIAQIVLVRELLVTFLGSELSLGIVLANWLGIQALGSWAAPRLLRRAEGRGRREAFVAVQLAFAVSLVPALVLARRARLAAGLALGQAVGFPAMVAMSAAALAPVALCHGALFALACAAAADQGLSPAAGRPAAGRTIARVYSLAAFGTAIAGVAFTYVLLSRAHPVSTLLGVAALDGLTGAWVLTPLSGARRQPGSRLLAGASGALALAAAVLVAAGASDRLQRGSAGGRWPGLELVDCADSPYGNVAVTRREEQIDLYTDGRLAATLPTPDIASVEEAHFALLAHPAPARVLLIGGGIGGSLREILKHPVERVDYAELDPLVVEMAERHSPAPTGVSDPRVRVHRGDGRRLLVAAEGGYDLIVVGLADPADLKANRLFTAEFYALCRSRLAAGGLLAVRAAGSLTYLAEDLRRLNASLLLTLQEAFERVQVIPGDENLYLAGGALAGLPVAADALAARLAERAIPVRLVTPYYLRYRLDAQRLSRLMEVLRTAQARVNRDFVPSAVYYSLTLLNARLAPGLGRWYRAAGSLSAAPLLAACALGLPLLPVVRRLLPRAFARAALPAVVLTTGFAGLFFDLTLVLAYQIVHGSLYQRVGLLVTAFLAGTGVGAALTAGAPLAKRSPQTAARALLALLEGAAALFALKLAVLFAWGLPWLLGGRGSRLFGLSEPLFYLVCLAGGCLVGAEFAAAARVLSSAADERAHAGAAAAQGAPAAADDGLVAGAVNAADLAGGWIAGLLGGAFLLPVLGLPAVALLVAVLKLGGLGAVLLQMPAAGRGGAGRLKRPAP